MRSSIFITFEGIEGSGKTTQAKLLKDFLKSQGHEVVLTREPGGPPISERIRGILLDNANPEMEAMTELLLYEASRYQHVKEVIRPALANGKMVICDRFADASTAYQGYGRGIDIKKVESLNFIATEGILPDLTFLLDVPCELGLRRLGRNPDRIESETIEFHERVRRGYLEIARSEPERIKVVDGLQSVDRIFESIKALVSEVISKPRR
ncbi:MAG: dTMP kinase [bacterium]